MRQTAQRGVYLPALLLAVFCVYTAVTNRLYRDPVDLAPPQPTRSRLLDFEPARRALDGTQRVGFVHLHDFTDPGFPADGYLYLVQYALAPVLVENSIDPERVIALVFSAEKFDAFLTRTGLRVVDDYGNGLVLLEHEEGE